MESYDDVAKEFGVIQSKTRCPTDWLLKIMVVVELRRLNETLKVLSKKMEGLCD